jgi:probable F420-dependent oxidoreductase
MQIKYRIGIMPGSWPSGPPGGGSDFFWRLIDVCERTEIDSIWFSDRLSSPLPVLEPMTAMAAVAARTRRLKFGPSVLIAPFRSPVLAARQLAMLDYLSGGRVLPAVGIGVEQEREFLAAGVPFRERGRRTDEAIQVMRRCWEEPEVTFAGEFWRLDRITVLPRPVQQPMPLWVGGNSEAAMRRAGRMGDGWIPSFITPDQFRVGVDKTLTFAAEAGREVPGDHFGTLVNFCLDSDPMVARSIALPFIPRGRAHRS